ncbi:MAG: hypothetical protein HZT41_06375 [Dechloromonas sp.]|nr:MAG: hypothetical protein HZT41_06375 [Dechloromonas sp.]
MGIVPAQVPAAEFEGAVLQPADGLAFGLLVVQIAFYLFGKVRREKPADADVLPGSKFWARCSVSASSERVMFCFMLGSTRIYFQILHVFYV